MGSGYQAVVVGEALVDIVLTAEGEQHRPGGSPLNVAVGLARLGVSTCLVADLGDDAAGSLVREHLERAGVELSHLVGAARTSTATARIGASGAAEYEFDVSWTLDGAPLPPGGLVHTGSIATILAPGADRVAELVLRRPEGVLASFDPNARPGLIADRDDALGRIEALFGVDIVKLSDEDAAWLYPGQPLEAVEDRVLAAGASLVAITRGADGARLRTAWHAVEVAAPATAVVDTIGAGDSFMAGLLSGVIASGIPADVAALAALGDLAATCAAITVSRRGADPPWARELAG